nr:PREDICTED: docking protein 3 [Latimeria chalumnae]|eukprot:XP_005992419.1 PREDICTED: docking protein 3 [Latimeria chalumnae]
MENPIKEGTLYVQHNIFGKKFWKKTHTLLFPSSQNGIARVEQFESGSCIDKQALKKTDKVIRLAECISITHAPVGHHPKNMTAFCINTNDKTYLMASEDTEEWMEMLCELAFQDIKNKKESSTISPHLCSSVATDQMKMEENAIYSSWPEAANRYSVMIWKTEASTRCNLEGNYILELESDSIVLKDSRSKQVLYTWPYELLRRFGKDQNVLSFEAGRRCESGQGVFTFCSKWVQEIFSAISSKISQQNTTMKERQRSGEDPDLSSSFETGAICSETPSSSYSKLASLSLSSQDSNDGSSTKLGSFQTVDERSQSGKMPALKNNEEEDVIPETELRDPLEKIKSNNGTLSKGNMASLEQIQNTLLQSQQQKEESCASFDNLPDVGKQYDAFFIEKENCDKEALYATIDKQVPNKMLNTGCEGSKWNTTQVKNSSEPFYQNCVYLDNYASVEEKVLSLCKPSEHTYGNEPFKHHHSTELEEASSLYHNSDNIQNWVTLKQQREKTQTEKDGCDFAQRESHNAAPAYFRRQNLETNQGKTIPEDTSPRSMIVTKVEFPEGFRETLTNLISKDQPRRLFPKRQGYQP